jgi:dolichol-phosphate mannosyltransferase
LWVLAEPRLLGLPVLPSKVIAAEVALINNFVLNEIWTFRQPVGTRGQGSVYKRLLFFNTICGVGILIAVALLYLFHSLLAWNLYVSNALAIGLVTAWNFILNARFNWRVSARLSRESFPKT